ncbi:hypothetical protein KC363_g4034 [Hortaea werneckii]|uniref:Mitochondrial transcription factor 1 n=1 Tax=Hortaea werneckii TaxID=91943 RepID=A0A3M7FFG3_HORWE|nr:hypothetical protein KC325_g7426 [Hortaea werneckii]KAI6988510.1 hypothetical protein KC359_g7698 [Hortaea werneckii]KAI7142227.1 hypothetical protein KC344_g7372 [Hortaea werneckii]KAI7169480.1 hypothetical protein KC360_g7420 [Hortaea werneckii]KAI7191119.1 hypothetical protein KC363_g4034 [Hortaea werneckii]
MVQPLYRAVADKRHPITRKLTEVFGGRLTASPSSRVVKAHGEKGASPRQEIVSEKLIDDTIAYLAPTLEQHKGCTLVDILPGACLFSSKLHDFLKPKRHILMEPEERYYEPFIKPLLDKSGSTYRYTTMTGAHPSSYWQSYPKMLGNPDWFPGHQELKIDDPRRRQFRPDILVVGNLSRRFKVRRRVASVQWAIMVLQQMGYATLENNLIHHDGLVRMLWWLPEALAHHVFPPTETSRFATPLMLDMGCEINQTVGTTSSWTDSLRKRGAPRLRPDVFRDVIRNRCSNSMDKLGMKQPKGRPFLMRYEGEDLEKFVVNPLQNLAQTVPELEEKVKTVEDRMGKIRESGLTGRMGGRKESHPLEKWLYETIAYTQLPHITPAYEGRKANVIALAIIADEVLRTINLEASFKALEEKSQDPDALEPLRKRIIDISEAYEDFTRDRTYYKEWTDGIVDEHMAILAEPTLLALDRRAYEPLQASDSDFWPRNNMMLVDQMPIPRDLSVPDLSSAMDGAKTANMLIRYLMQARTKSVPAALETLAPNASKDLIPQVPAMTDPRKGGRMHLESFRVRNLNADMIEGLTKAWAEWPFTPSTIELELALANLAPGKGEGEESEGVKANVVEEED